MNTITLSQHEEFLLDLLQTTIASNSPVLALQTKEVLETAVTHGECDRSLLWQQLTPDEKAKFKELISCTH